MSLARWVAMGVLIAGCEHSSSSSRRPKPVALDVRVTPRHVSIAGKDLTKPMPAAILDQLRARRDVIQLVPRLDLAFSALAAMPKGPAIQLAGNLDGVDPAPAAGPPVPDAFVDWDDHDAAGPACEPDAASVAGSCADAVRDYCDGVDRTCHHRVPLVISASFVVFYNERVAVPTHQPAIGGLEEAMVARRPLAIDLTLGDTRRVGATLVGISRRAMPLGFSVPLGYVRRWNQTFGGEHDATAIYSAVDVTLRDRDDLDGFRRWAAEQELDVAPGGAGIYDVFPATSSAPSPSRPRT